VRGFGKQKVCLVGHDFGGGVAWGTAMVRPELVSRLAILNSVHPVGFEHEMRKWSEPGVRKPHGAQRARAVAVQRAASNGGFPEKAA
jgi:pimeloyl-ACP methyl ester carboxylesterase